MPSTAAIEKDIAQRTEARLVKQHVERLATLTPRERQVLREVAYGRLNKQIAFELGISEVTVKLHRGNVMRKMQAASVGRARSRLGSPCRLPFARSGYLDQSMIPTSTLNERDGGRGHPDLLR